jgi:hypothetical protein
MVGVAEVRENRPGRAASPRQALPVLGVLALLNRAAPDHPAGVVEF